MVSISNFVKFISENYVVEVVDGKVELTPFNNMQMNVIREGKYDSFPYTGLE